MAKSRFEVAVEERVVEIKEIVGNKIWLTIAEASDILRISSRQFDRNYKSGEYSFKKIKLGRSVSISTKALAEYTVEAELNS